MKKRSENFDARCWALAKRYFEAQDKLHIARMIERSVEMTDEQNKLKRDE